ncbi:MULTISPECIES: flagellar hook-basal body protein [Bacillaceae]|uniref:flagellar hook-basal body protein n=1 Tax=Bacillaceae TaxID=186817 RepID=UPI000B9AFB17|nr:flagellar hook-basal body protein [Bacillus infantis]MDW2876389.1 flagellar hook-basal body protein [Bacillus infantis]OXT16061.1 flagellar biosynthesis protein FlgC [Bacillus sp. OG2]
MFRGFYTVASGMLSQQRKTEMLTNNMANANTPGFKADQASMRAFPEMLLQSAGQYSLPVEKGYKVPVNQPIGPINTGVYMQEAMANFLQGDIRETNQKTDLALVDLAMPINEAGIAGSAFFKVEGADGQVRYTRNGDFTLDGEGFLTTSSGQYILDDGDNRIQLASDQFTVDEAGRITGANGETGIIGIAFAADPQRLIKEGGGLYRTDDGNPLENAAGNPDAGFQLKQGFLEGSNVDSSRTMTDMLTAYRSFEANQKVLQAYDKSMEKAANEIGRVG